MTPTLDRQLPLHFIGVGGIGMSALAGILAARGFQVSGSDPRNTPVVEGLRQQGVRVFPRQEAATIAALCDDDGLTPLVVISSAVPESNTELAEARRRGLTVLHRSDILAALINAQPSIAVAGSHGKTTTSTLVATLLEATQQDPTAVIGGVVPAFGSNGRQGEGRLLVAEADESDGSLVKFAAHLGVLTNIELDHTDHYPNLQALIDTLQRFAAGSQRLLANRDCPILREHFQAHSWWSIETAEGVPVRRGVPSAFGAPVGDQKRLPKGFHGLVTGTMMNPSVLWVTPSGSRKVTECARYRVKSAKAVTLRFRSSSAAAWTLVRAVLGWMTR